MQPHEARQIAESFGSDPERYDRSRPGYPDAIVAAIVDASPGREVLDVGCGTGIAARQFEAAGCSVLGVEPDERMAGFARRRGLDVEVASFEDWRPAGREFDAVTSGQAWHWVDPAAGAEKASEALRAGGRVALFWNAFEAPPALTAAFADVYRQVMPDFPRNPWARAVRDAYAPIFDKVSDGLRGAGTFGEPEQWAFEWARPYTRDEWLEQMLTGGDVSQFAPALRDELVAGTAAAIDDFGGSFTMQYTAVVITARRSGA